MRIRANPLFVKRFYLPLPIHLCSCIISNTYDCSVHVPLYPRGDTENPAVSAVGNGAFWLRIPSRLRIAHDAPENDSPEYSASGCSGGREIIFRSGTRFRLHKTERLSEPAQPHRDSTRNAVIRDCLTPCVLSARTSSWSTLFTRVNRSHPPHTTDMVPRLENRGYHDS